MTDGLVRLRPKFDLYAVLVSLGVTGRFIKVGRGAFVAFLSTVLFAALVRTLGVMTNGLIRLCPEFDLYAVLVLLGLTGRFIKR